MLIKGLIMYVFKIVRDHIGDADYDDSGKWFGYGMKPSDRYDWCGDKIIMTIYDDDDTCYYTVHYWGDEDEESIFAPLDWAAENAGAAKCKIKGEWL